MTWPELAARAGSWLMEGFGERNLGYVRAMQSLSASVPGESVGHALSDLGAFVDIWAGNAEFAAHYDRSALKSPPAKRLAIITCIDSRIAPLATLGLDAGDASILRNAGARVSEDVLRTLVLATYVLNVTRVLVMPHTRCAMAGKDEAAIHARIAEEHGVDTRSVEFRTTGDVASALAADLTRIRAYPLLPADLAVAGAVYDVDTGRLHPL